MALPTEDLDWVSYLAARHDAERPELEVLDRYYEGTQPLTYMHPEIFREVSDRIQPVIIAWPQLVVDSVEERLDVEGFRLPEADPDPDLWRVWQANDLDELSQQGHVDALVMRRSYACVGSTDDPDTPLVTVESPLEVIADIDPRTRDVRAALRRVGDLSAVSPSGERWATLYLPNRTVWYAWDGQWVEENRDEHNLGAVPVVPLVNRPRLSGARLLDQVFPEPRTGKLGTVRADPRYGRSELAPVLPLSDAANKLATDMVLAGEFVALPLRGVFGIGPADLVDEHGNPMTALQAIMGRLLTISDTEAKAFEFAAARLDNFGTAIEQLARLVASIAGIPPHYLGQSTDNPASADAIRSAESRLVKRAERKQRAFGGSWERVMRLVRRFQEGDWDPKLRQMETTWRDASTPTVAQKADAAIKLYTAPAGQRPIVSLRQTREDLNYTAAQITRMEESDEREAALDPVGQLTRALGQSGGGGVPVDDQPVPA